MAILIGQADLRSLLERAYVEGWEAGGQVSLATAREEELPNLLNELVRDAVNADKRNM